jgi:membrane protein DedA with SNARE-associated domain
MGKVEAASEPRPLTRGKVLLLFSPLVALIVIRTVVNSAAPWLLKHHPLGLVALDGRNRNLLLAASRIDLWYFVIFACIARMLTDPIHYLIGRAFGDRAMVWLRKQLGETNRFLAWLERSFHKAGGVMVFAMPGAPVCLMAGITGMRVRRFFILNLLGTLTAVLLLRGAASALEAPLQAVLDFNDRYVGILTPLFIGLGVVQMIRVRRRRSSGPMAITELATAEVERSP